MNITRSTTARASLGSRFPRPTPRPVIQEAKNPRRDLPRAIIGSLIIVTLLYVLVAVGTAMLIGADTVVGAGSVVTQDVPPHTLVVGVPARILRRLEEEKERPG